MEKRSQFLVDISKLILFADAKGIELICFDFDRSQSEQEQNILKGVSWTKTSRHLKWQAMDLAIVEKDGKLDFSNDGTVDYNKYEILGNFWESLGSGHIWGAGKFSNGKRKDVYHFEVN